jgi:hypothetical protein
VTATLVEPVLTTTQHLALADALADQSAVEYDLAESTHDRAAAWAHRKQAEHLAADANHHYDLAGV